MTLNGELSSLRDRLPVRAVNRIGSENEAEQSFGHSHTMIPEQSQAGYELTSSLFPRKHSPPEWNLSGFSGLLPLMSWCQVAAVSTSSHFQRNSLPSIHMRCMMTPSQRASATFARALPRRFATSTANRRFTLHMFRALHSSSRKSADGVKHPRLGTKIAPKKSTESRIWQ